MLNQIKNFFTRGWNTPAVPLSQAYDILVNGNANSAGIAVTNETVLGSSGVWRAVNLISSSIARLPCVVYKRLPDGGRVKDKKVPAGYILGKQPSQNVTPFIFFQTMMQHALVHGNGYAYIYRDTDATPLSVQILDPQLTTPLLENGNLFFVTTIGNEQRKLLPENIIHFKGMGYNGWHGYPVIDILRDTFGHGLALLKYGNVFFKNNGSPNTIIELPGFFKDEEAIERFRRNWGNIHTGLENAHKVALLENGAKISKLGGSNEEAQWLDSREFDLKALANVFGLPPHKLGANHATSYGSLEQENRSFLNESLGGWLAMIEQELEAKLLTEAMKRSDSHFVEFQRAELERADLVAEVNALVIQVNNGLLTLDEARQIQNRPLVPNGLGEAHRIPANLQELGAEPPDTPAVAALEASTEPPAAANKDSQRLHELTVNTLQRLVTRMAKDATWERVKHEGVIKEQFELFPRAENIISDWLDSIQEELASVLPEQRKEVFANIDIEALAQRIIND